MSKNITNMDDGHDEYLIEPARVQNHPSEVDTMRRLMNTTIKSKRLVKWLVAQGADIDMTYNFGLEKGMGERIEVWIVDEGRVQ